MHERPQGCGDAQVISALDEAWGIVASSVENLAVGFGSYHWIVTDQTRQRHFVTVDDLDHKDWLGETCDAAFQGLRKAFDAAVALRDKGGLRFVLAPLATVGGEPLHRLGRRHSLALFPFIDGLAGDFGDDASPQQRGDVVRMLAELHLSTPSAQQVAAWVPLDFAGRPGLEAALHRLDHTWHGGPFAEPARAWLLSHSQDLVRLLDDFDRRMTSVEATRGAPVITHGEPHPGNVMRGRDGLVLIDWDTVGLAPPERDLWLVATDSGEEVALYTETTGHEVSTAAMSFYRLAWDLTDVAAYLHLFQSSHVQTQDTEQAWLSLERAI